MISKLNAGKPAQHSKKRQLHPVGRPVKKPFWKTLTHAADIAGVEGPLTSKFVGADGGEWIVHWADCDDEAHRWLVFAPGNVAVQAIEKNDELFPSLVREAILTGEVFVVDIIADGAMRVRSETQLLGRDLPHSYLPPPKKHVAKRG